MCRRLALCLRKKKSSLLPLRFSVRKVLREKEQEIADNRGINKAMLHYHFQNKDTLFKAVFLESFKALISTVIITLSAPGTLRANINNTVDGYISELLKTPELPLFVLSELKHNAEFIQTLAEQSRPFRDSFDKQVSDAIKSGELRPMASMDVFANVTAFLRQDRRRIPGIHRGSKSTRKNHSPGWTV